MRVAVILLFLGASACGQDAQIQKYRITAFENVGVQPDTDPPIIKDARERIPTLLRSCAIHQSERVTAYDSAIIFQFAADQNQMECLRKSTPPGAEITEAQA